MSRLELGFVLSRVLAILALMAVVRFFWLVPSFFTVPVLDGGVALYQQVGWPVAAFAAVGLLLLLAARLWFGAGALGRWSERDDAGRGSASGSGDGVFDRSDAAYLLCRGLGVYLAVLTVFSVYNWGRTMQFNLSYAEADVARELWVSSAVVALVPTLAAGLWFGAGRIAHWMGQMTGTGVDRVADWTRLAFGALGVFLIVTAVHLLAQVAVMWSAELWVEAELAARERLRLYAVATQAGAGILLLVLSILRPPEAAKGPETA